MESTALTLAGGLAAIALLNWGPYASLAGNLCVQAGIGYSVYQTKQNEATPLLPLCLGATLISAGVSCCKGYQGGGAIHWINASLSTVGPLSALLKGVQMESLKVSLWGEASDLNGPANGPLAKLWRHWGNGFSGKAQATGLFMIGAMVPLAVQNWLKPHPTLTATATCLVASLGAIAWTRIQDDDGESWSNGVCNPLYLGALAVVAGLDIWQLAEWAGGTTPFWSFSRILQLSTLGLSGLAFGGEVLRATKEPSIFG